MLLPGFEGRKEKGKKGKQCQTADLRRGCAKSKLFFLPAQEGTELLRSFFSSFSFYVSCQFQHQRRPSCWWYRRKEEGNIELAIVFLCFLSLTRSKHDNRRKSHEGREKRPRETYGGRGIVRTFLFSTAFHPSSVFSSRFSCCFC